MPTADPFMLHIRAAVAEEERRLISQRTQAALSVAKARGVKLGTHGATLFIPERNKKQADQFALAMQPIIEEIQHRGVTTLRGIAEELNRRGVPTARGGDNRWHHPIVYHILKRIQQLNRKERTCADKHITKLT